MFEMKFYQCLHCGNIAVKVVDKGVPLVCCGEKMVEVAPNTTDAAAEKHVPVIAVDGSTVTVTVGEVAHPMAEDHYIEWIILRTTKGASRVILNPGDEPKAVFSLVDAEPVEAIAYCNKHGLWSAQA